MRRSVICAITILLLLSVVNPTTAEDEITPVLENLRRNVLKMELSNGLRVLVYQRPQVPIFSGQIWVKVGGVNESPGHTGIAHMLEHMAFKGTTSIGTKDYETERKLLDELEEVIRKLDSKEELLTHPQVEAIHNRLRELWVDDEFSRVYQREGAHALNAMTAKDYTGYVVSLPSSAFLVWCWLESERLLRPVFRQFYQEREVVIEERRSRTDDDPDGLLYEALLSTAFWSSPNRQPVIGWPSDLKRLTASEIKEFYATHYRPDNIVLVLVGDIKLEGLQEILERYFGRIQLPAEVAPPLHVTAEEPQNGERNVVVHFDAEPRFMMAFHKPVYPNPDDVVLDVLSEHLSGGRSSVFYRELVLEKQLASVVDVFDAPGQQFSSLFVVYGQPRNGVSNRELRDAVQAILERYKSKPIAPAELEAIKRRIVVSFLRSLTSNYSIAENLGKVESLRGDWRWLLKIYEDLLAVSAEQVQQAATKYLTVTNRTFVHQEKGES